jgi:ubiquinone biosynthesis monooxygenase Coq7
VSDKAAPPEQQGAWLPGDLTPQERVARILRVDHAGEYGAKRIYDGQLAVLGRRPGAAQQIRHMHEQELRHLKTFETLIAERRVRPTLLTPLWHVAGYALGAATALMGERAAMACTIAVEEVIDEHYRRQADGLGPEEADLKQEILAFRKEELEHRDTAVAAGGTAIAGYAPLAAAIKAGSRLAIWLSERI